MSDHLTISFLVPAPLAGKTLELCSGIYEPSQLAERVFTAWLSGGSVQRHAFRPPARKAGILEAWIKARAGGKSTRQYLRELRHRRGIRISHATLHNWHARFERDGLEGLNDQRAARCRERRRDWSSDPFMQHAREQRELPEHPSMAECHRRAMAQAQLQGWETRSFKAVDRYLRSLARQKNQTLGRPESCLRTS